jgi:hypothetical protein
MLPTAPAAVDTSTTSPGRGRAIVRSPAQGVDATHRIRRHGRVLAPAAVGDDPVTDRVTRITRGQDFARTLPWHHGTDRRRRGQMPTAEQRAQPWIDRQPVHAQQQLAGSGGRQRRDPLGKISGFRQSRRMTGDGDLGLLRGQDQGRSRGAARLQLTE